MFKSPGHIAFSISSIDIHWYGIIMSLAILAGIFVIIAMKNKYYKEISTDTICDISFYLIIFGLLSARIYYVILDFPYFIRHPFEIPAIWNGGIAIQGAIIGGIIAGYAYTKEHKLNFLKIADLFSFGLITGQIIGRWGNFFNSEAFGLPTNLPWKLYIPYPLRPVEFKGYEYFHPTFLYESILNIIVLAILFYIFKKTHNQNKYGIIFFSYLILYSITRILVETIRLDSVLNISIFHVAHIAAIALLAVGIAGLIFIFKKQTS